MKQMATTTRRRRRRRVSTFSGAIRRYGLAILFIVLGSFIIGVIGYVTSLVPEVNLTIGSGTGAVSISNKLIINFISWIAGVLFVLTGIRRFGIRI